jgi:hypothetical protein
MAKIVMRRNPPAHRDSAAMNGAQLLMAHSDSSGLMSVPPAGKSPIFKQQAGKAYLSG